MCIRDRQQYDAIVARKRRRPAVLEEDQYTDAVQRIIERDFFPDLAKTRLTREFLQASQSEDPKAMWRFQQQFSKELREVAGVVASSSFETPGATPARGGSTAAPPMEAAVAEDCVDDAIKHMPLDKFLNKFTSEDNAAFEVIFEKEVRERKKKTAWQRAGIQGDERLAALEPSTQSTAAPVTWAYKATNALMYPPEGIGTMVDAKEEVMGPPKAVVHSNTRFEMPKAIKNTNPANTRLPGPEFSLLRSPSPAPGVGESPLITWGRIDGTPIALDGGGLGDAVNPFKMQGTSAREQVGLDLSNGANARMAKRKGKQLNKTSLTRAGVGINTNSGMMPTLSPAAQRLLRRGTPTGVDSQLRSAYRSCSHTPIGTPSHGSRRPTSERRPTGDSTPVVHGARQGTSLTDGLLKI
eukprot:TRINITY_DN19904_c0_g1_i2.p1 TRINITY_DN19904_c0_g1~~TRINITY_DN19904_c0_g1_i2.p1  ORF type:complete len:411 (+),score=88.28 TRINITY_DN19904_c0_g1_i2:138-1370(+)